MISVVIPTRNRARQLDACLAGLARQDAKATLADVVVVDDGSTEEHAGGMERWRRNLPLRFAPLGRRRGAAFARNVGAGLAQGEILAFLDDDAVPEEGWLECIERSMKDPAISALTGRILAGDGPRLGSRARQIRYDLRESKLPPTDWSAGFLTAGNCAVRAEVFRACGGFHEDFELMHDREFCLRLKVGGGVCRYVHNMAVRHDHDKGLLVALTRAIKSGRFRRWLELTYGPEDGTRVWRTVAELVSAGSSRGDVGAGILASVLELVHALGYQWHRLVERKAPQARQQVDSHTKGPLR